MKKRLICILLILIIAFSLSACTVVEDELPQGSGYVGDGNTSDVPELDEKEPDDSNPKNDIPNLDEYVTLNIDSESDYTGADFGEKGYSEYLYEWYSQSHCKNTLINSVDELKEFCETARIKEMYLSRRNANETGRGKFSDQLSQYSSKYFEKNSLILIFCSASSGSYWYSVKDVETEGNAVNVTLQYWRTLMDMCDMKYWGIIIECPKSDVEGLNVVTETKEQQRRPNGVKINLGLTHDVSLETIYHIYSSEDFSELDFEFTVEEFSEALRDKIGQLLIEHPLDYWVKHGDYWNRETIINYTRMLVINLAEKSTDNVLRAMELLIQREEIEWVEPAYEYYFEID